MSFRTLIDAEQLRALIDPTATNRAAPNPLDADYAAGHPLGAGDAANRQQGAGRAVHHPPLAILDCRFDLMKPEAGRQAFDAGHIPGARYGDLNQDLSAPVTAVSGRHPLPSPEQFAETLGRLGIRKDTQVIAYDEVNGSFAARLWWLMRWVGHADVAVLDGGFKAWTAAGGAVQTGSEEPADRNTADPNARPDLNVPEGVVADGAGRGSDTVYRLERAEVRQVDAARRLERARLSRADAYRLERVDAGAVVNAAELADALEHKALLVDARAAERFAGVVEPIDAVAGHVAGAVNKPFTDNLTGDGRFLAPDELRRRWQRRLGGTQPAQVIAMCGSGVTACHNLLSMEIAGLSGARLYAGSWSEWIRDPARPIARGP